MIELMITHFQMLMSNTPDIDTLYERDPIAFHEQMINRMNKSRNSRILICHNVCPDPRFLLSYPPFNSGLDQPGFLTGSNFLLPWDIQVGEAKLGSGGGAVQTKGKSTKVSARSR